MTVRFRDDRLRLLISYHYAQTLDLDEWLPKHFDPPYPELFFDSGAFSTVGSITRPPTQVWT